MRQSLLLPVLIWILFGMSLATAQGGPASLSIHARVLDAVGLSASNVTVRVSTPDGQIQTHRTNETGAFFATLPAGSYRIRVFSPNESGELWHDRAWTLDENRPIENPLTLNRTLPHLLRAPLIADPDRPDLPLEALPSGTNMHIQVPLRHPKEDPGNRSILVEVFVYDSNGTELENATLGSLSMNPDSYGWVNGTIPATNEPPYYARKQTLEIRLRVTDNDSGQLYDQGKPYALEIKDECPDSFVGFDLEFSEGNATILCVAAGDMDAWVQWRIQAKNLVAIRAQALQEAEANAPNWTALEALQAWEHHLESTRPLSEEVLGTLDRIQTDRTGYPTWSDLESLRIEINRDHLQFHDRVAEKLEPLHRSGEKEIATQKWRILGTVGVLSAAFATGGSFLSFAVLRTWKRKAEYWLGYTSRSEPTPPLYWIFPLLLGGILLGAAFAWASSGPELVRFLMGG